VKKTSVGPITAIVNIEFAAENNAFPDFRYVLLFEIPIIDSTHGSQKLNNFLGFDFYLNIIDCAR